MIESRNLYIHEEKNLEFLLHSRSDGEGWGRFVLSAKLVRASEFCRCVFMSLGPWEMEWLVLGVSCP
jgi:hypothetical protein